MVIFNTHHIMEFLNKIQLRGIVGAVREVAVESTKTYRFSLATEYCYRGVSGMPTVEVTWHNVVAFSSPGENWDWLQKGAKVEVEGRICNRKYVGSDGVERTVSEIRAHSLKLIEGEGE